MNLNKKVVTIGIGILVILWIGNIFYYKQHILKEPIFLKHYCCISQGRDRFKLVYIENINSKEKIVSIKLPEIGEEFIDWGEYHNNDDGIYYRMKSIVVRISEKDIEKYKNRLITKAEIYFSDGKNMNVDIGNIYLCDDRIDERLFHTESASSSSDNIGESTLMLERDMKINGVESRFPEIINDIIKIKINDTLLKDVKFPMKLKKGDKFNVSYSFKFNKDDIRKNYIYDVPLDIIYEYSNKTKRFTACFAKYRIQSPQNINIKALINKKEIN
ncbi:hypothetical protein BD780_001924 [Clostridium tetanomorphum]|uniref:hypothetical protein n=1 Tax=Clostridium tetanomorphum TaxID=1553 RepID=UPI000451AE21|nr:hypothetical protein [Clostridium tetanomorphum]KAJ51514.1 hypothetical protein CTM_12190 [Clostridium tetanomorphum DSM 665]MBP1865162.1 hypothetical protein [Clostridium tetanomorphum]NRS84699.1 hypothetical protein [Clostridium tetanomorphum]SQB91801.1 Uncharacterised protein [Clostridium tetanomorphum]